MRDTARRPTGMPVVIIVAALTLASAGAAGKWDFTLTSAEQRALAAITPAALRAHMSFLAADALDGRGAGTRGLDVAAEYIAAQFRGAGLKPAGDDEYFQATPRVRVAPSADGYRSEFVLDGRTVNIPPAQFALVPMLGFSAPVMRELDVEQAPVYKIPYGGSLPERIPDPHRTVIITDTPPLPSEQSQVGPFVASLAPFERKLAGLSPALIIEVRRGPARASEYFSSSSLFDPQNRPRAVPATPIVALSGDGAAAIYNDMPAGPTGATFTVHVNAPVERSVAQRNVIGVLPGSDPALAGTYVLVTAHYDGQGTRPGPDPIWNSANDNGTGTVTVIALASALSALKKPPRRSIVFIAFHGEESGLVGSRYYAQHPVVAIDKTVAGLNIEMVGRTDDADGDQHRRASITGFDYSDIGEIFKRAGALTGITVFRHPKNSDPYFNASDNQPLANLGVPAHTVCVAFQPPDYHGPADTWQKIDYDNMALTVRMIGTALLGVANSREEPRWNPTIQRANRYLEAWKKQHGGRD